MGDVTKASVERYGFIVTDGNARPGRAVQVRRARLRGDLGHRAQPAVCHPEYKSSDAATGVSPTAEIVPPPSLAAFDSARILQVLTNLLSNAIKFTNRLSGRIVVRVESFGDEIRFAVSDTGVGIATDKLKAVFVRFLQVIENDRRGVGLGLYISKAIVQGHGGRIRAESKVGDGGLRCYFTLPIHVAS